ncbi:CHAT domain-containing protein [Rivularia sp. PCC 7116]|uniref:CHAT domain-containing protein n=1 Tax=Rivularia sp. PCC 7116 TaxID=373994 RepID=UPI0012FAEAFC|nr:CHAT domain-containing protein [Rivularia sp. PCC 7116]
MSNFSAVAIPLKISVKQEIKLVSQDLCLNLRDSFQKLTIQNVQQYQNTGKIIKQVNFTSNFVDKLRLIGLRKKLGEDCKLYATNKDFFLDNRDTAIFRSMMLKNGIAITLMLYDADSIKLKIHWVPIPEKVATKTVNELRRSLETLSDRQESYKEKAQEVYNWFILPFTKELQHIKTLVFIQNRILWTIPMASLYDGKHFLVEKYAIAHTPSLSLTNPHNLNSENIKILAFGLTSSSAIDKQTFFPPLSGVKAEIEGIRKLIPHKKIFLNKRFTTHNLSQQLKKYQPNILHLASHARFSYDSQQPFLVTGEEKITVNKNPSIINFKRKQAVRKYNKILKLRQLYQIIRKTQINHNQFLELLTLTGCQTAIGRKRDAILIASLSLQSKVKSTVASLWNIDDAATASLIVDFYKNLLAGMSKAEALQAAQKKWLVRNSAAPYSHPGYWAPFILVGDWL